MAFILETLLEQPEGKTLEFNRDLSSPKPLLKILVVSQQTKRFTARVRLESRLESTLAAKVLLKLHEQETGKSALAQYLGHKTVSGELHKQIKRLLELELIEMTLPDKPNSRLQKYRLTSKGLELISNKGLSHD